MQANRDEIARKKRLKETRRNFAGPLKHACSDADRLITSVLAPPGDDFYHEFFPDKPEMSLYGSIYFFCRSGHILLKATLILLLSISCQDTCCKTIVAMASYYGTIVVLSHLMCRA